MMKEWKMEGSRNEIKEMRKNYSSQVVKMHYAGVQADFSVIIAFLFVYME